MPNDDQTRILRGEPTPTGPAPAAGPLRDDAREDGTRVLSAREAGQLTARLQTKPVERLSDKIPFFCQNGHRILAKRQDAGRRGKCSKCGVDVQIPEASVEPAAAAPLAPGPAADADESVSPPAVVAVAGVPPSPAAAAADSGETTGDDVPGAAAESAVSWDFVAGGSATGGVEEPLPVRGEEAIEEGDWSAIDLGGLFDDEGGNPTAQLVSRLFLERNHGVIELHLAGGGVVFPKWYDARWSRGTHGLFASEAADGSITLTAVAWGTVEKVIVRQLTDVPRDLFPSN